MLWTRQYIVSSIAASADAQAAANRLLANQEQIGAAIVPYYGQAAGNKLSSLLKQHILIAVDLVDAAKANDQAKLNDADQRWHTNAADIATFLSNANPNWKRDALLSMLNQHLALTTQEAVNRIKGNWTSDISNFDQIFDQAMMMADALSGGIVQQFPSQFTTESLALASWPVPTLPPMTSARVASSVINVALNDYRIDIPDSLPAGKVTFHVMNYGNVLHSFGIRSGSDTASYGTTGMSAAFDRSLPSTLQPGQSTTLEVDLQPGSYLTYCPVGNHASAHGMVHTVTVK